MGHKNDKEETSKHKGIKKIKYSDKSDKSMDLWNLWNLRIYPRIYKEIWGFNPKKLQDFMMNRWKEKLRRENTDQIRQESWICPRSQHESGTETETDNCLNVTLTHRWRKRMNQPSDPLEDLS